MTDVFTPPSPELDVFRPIERPKRRLAVPVAFAVCFAVSFWQLGANEIVNAIFVLQTVVFVAFLVRHLLFLGAASSPRLARTLEPDADHSFLPSVTVLLPCHNEELVVRGLVAAVDALDYPRDRFQAIFINDNSSDETGRILREELEGRPDCFLIERGPDATGGKSGGLNRALAFATGQILVVFDGDHHPDPQSLRLVVRHFAEPGVATVQGRCIVENPFESRLSRLIAIDYLCGYLVNMVGRQAVFDLPAYGGANCAVRADALRAAGGWNEDSVTEDTDLTIRLLLDGWRCRYEPSAVDSEQGVTKIGQFWRQRYRWARGHQQVCRDYRGRVWKAKHLSVAERVETYMFLFVFHIPALCMLSIGLVALRSFTGWGSGQFIDLWPLVPLMFAGPLLELGGGLVLSGARRVRVLDLFLFPLLYVVSMALCTKALVEGLIGKRYAWRKTERSARVGAVAPT
jgi:1,2-diacylglycerol 3-beta-glucosyltransferase